MNIADKLTTIAENQPLVLEAGAYLGYQMGFDDGEDTGYSDGYKDGHSQGSIEGEEIGRVEGYREGHNDGYNEGKTDGYNIGFEDGEDVGYQDGYTIGEITGKEAQEQWFWDVFQNKGQAMNYNSRFYSWQMTWEDTDKIYKPKYDFIHASNPNSVFRECYIKDIITDNYFDYKTSATDVMYTFYYATRLENARTLHVREDTKYTSAFAGCNNLIEVRFEGTIGQNGLNFSSSTKLSYESLMSIIEHLKDYSGTGTTKTVTLGATNLAKLTDAEKAIATEKGWTLA